MGRKYVKKADVVKINAYLYLTDAIITSRGGYWEVSTPQETCYYETTADLMDFITENLKYMKESVEPEMYKEAFNNDGRLRL